MFNTDYKFRMGNPVKFNAPNVTGVWHDVLQCYISALLSEPGYGFLRTLSPII
jgi:hypothetical protein